MSSNDLYVRYYDNVFPMELCNRLIDFLKKHIVDGKYTRNDAHHLRNSELTIPHKNILGSGKLATEVNKHLIHLSKTYKDDVAKSTGADTVYSCQAIEGLKIMRYNSNTNKPERFAYHADAWNVVSSSRQISVILYLNDVEEGGATHFRHQNISVKPKQGRVVFFPSNWIYTHKGEAPISNNKYILVTWLHFKGQTGYTTFSF